jgi:DNA-binding transcriptional MocR family regulator
MPEEVRWTTPGGGPTLWLDFPRELPLQKLAAALLARSIFIEDSTPAFFGEPHLNGFRVSYAYVPEAELRAALTVIGEETRKLLARST